MKWVSITDNLPYTYHFVLVTYIAIQSDEPNPVAIARLAPDKTWEYLGMAEQGIGIGAWSDLEWGISEVTHWMHLPKKEGY